MFFSSETRRQRPGDFPRKLLRKNNEKQAEIQKQQTQRGGAKRRPFGAAPKAPPCCLPFGKDFLCFWTIFEARSGSQNNFFTRRAGKIL